MGIRERKSGYQPKEDLAKSGCKPDIKYKYLMNLLSFGYIKETKY
jgi:hypothetical protein